MYVNRRYEYDSLGRLKRATGGQNVNWAQRYEYDRYGNRNNAYSFTAEQYVRNFYQNGLGRQPNATELSNWLTTLQTAYAQGQSQFLTAMQSLGQSIFNSQEYANRNRTNHWFVYDLYKTYLYREPDASGWAHWESQVPLVGRSNVRLAFDVSPEFSYKAGGTSPYAPPGGATVLPDGLQSLTFDAAANRITNTGWNYDAAGNQTRVQKGATWQRYQYDAANRLVKVKADDNVTVIGTYTYGADNQRLIAEEAGQRRYFATDRGGVVAELVENSGSTTPAWSKSYVYLGGRLLSTLTPNGSGGLLVDHHHPDQLGTRVVSNAQTTTSFEQVTLPFGTPLDSQSTGATNRRFTSYERSASTGLDYAVNRSYDSQQGRFTQVDPIGAGATSIDDPQTWNLYAYVGNDPINRTDPHGLFFKSFFKWLGKALKWIALAAMIATAIITVVGMVIGTVALKTFLTTTLLGKILAFTASIPDIIGGFISGLPKAIAGIFNFAERGTAIVTRAIGNIVLMGGSAAAGAVAAQLGQEARKETGKARRRREKAERRARRERTPTRRVVRVPNMPEIRTGPPVGTEPVIKVPPQPQPPKIDPRNPTPPRADATKWQKTKYFFSQGLRILGQYIKGSPIMIMVNPEALQEIACQENPYSRECIYGPVPGCCKPRFPKT